MVFKNFITPFKKHNDSCYKYHSSSLKKNRSKLACASLASARPCVQTPVPPKKNPQKLACVLQPMISYTFFPRINSDNSHHCLSLGKLLVITIHILVTSIELCAFLDHMVFFFFVFKIH
jgi:hypothetical protein